VDANPSWQYAPYIWPFVLTALIASVLGLYAWLHRAVAAAVPFSITAISSAFWSIASAVGLTQTDLLAKLFWEQLTYLSYTTVPLAWLAMILQYTGHEKWLTRPRLAALSAIPAVTIILALTNNLHGLVLRNAYLIPFGPLLTLGREYGPWFWVHASYSFLLLLISVGLLLRTLLRSSTSYRSQRLALLLATLPPSVCSLLFVLGLSPIPGLEVTPILLGLAGVPVGWALFRYHLFDIVPVAHHRVIEGMHDGVIVLDSKGQVIDLNPAARVIIGRSLADAVGLPAEEVFRSWPDLISLCRGESTRAQLVVGPDEARRHYEVQAAPVTDGRAQCLGQVITLHDNTERVYAERAMREANEQLVNWVSELGRRNREASFLNEMGELLQTCLTVEQAYQVISHSARRLFPEQAGALYVLDQARDVLETAASWGELDPVGAGLDGQECWALRRRRSRVEGDEDSGPPCRHFEVPLPPHSLCVPLIAQGEVLGVLHLRCESETSGGETSLSERVLEERQQLAVSLAEHAALAVANLRLRQSLREQAIRDPLTGLFNRRYLEETLEREVRQAQRRGNPLGIIMLDLDHFKQFNDAYGHEVGDALLQALGRHLQDHVRGGDIACRYGGEEFVFIMPDAPLEATAARADEIRRGAERVVVMHEGRVVGPVRISLGVAAFPEHGRSAAVLLRSADMALYQAKAAGRNQVALAGGAAGHLDVP